MSFLFHIGAQGERVPLIYYWGIPVGKCPVFNLASFVLVVGDQYFFPGVRF